jgi:hypothetical protein
MVVLLIRFGGIIQDSLHSKKQTFVREGTTFGDIPPDDRGP